MGQYRFSMYLNIQLGIMISYDSYAINIMMPFVSIHIATTKHAKGFDIFNLWMSHD